jgi:hypothetical protein
VQEKLTEQQKQDIVPVQLLQIYQILLHGVIHLADFTIDPGMWVLDNYGTKLIALIYNGQCFEWDASAGCYIY